MVSETQNTPFPSVLAGGALGALAARGVYRRLAARPPGGARRWERLNNRGRSVTLLEGPAVVVGIAVGAAVAPGVAGPLRLAGAGAALGAGAVGLYDDLRGSAAAKGFRGHLNALRHGELTTGVAKIVGIGATGLAAGCVLRRGPVDRALA